MMGRERLLLLETAKGTLIKFFNLLFFISKLDILSNIYMDENGYAYVFEYSIWQNEIFVAKM